jgi:hypothetical protein
MGYRLGEPRATGTRHAPAVQPTTEWKSKHGGKQVAGRAPDVEIGSAGRQQDQLVRARGCGDARDGAEKVMHGAKLQEGFDGLHTRAAQQLGVGVFGGKGGTSPLPADLAWTCKQLNGEVQLSGCVSVHALVVLGGGKEEIDHLRHTVAWHHAPRLACATSLAQRAGAPHCTVSPRPGRLPASLRGRGKESPRAGPDLRGRNR